MASILMGTDGSVHASTAMLTAARLLRLEQTVVDVLHVVQEPVPLLSEKAAHLHHAYKRHLASPARKTLDDAQRILAHAHVQTRGLFESGSPAEKLLDLTPGYDLTVVGAYGNHDRQQPGLGPVSSRLLQLTSGNVMVGRELVNEGNFRVLAALDSSEASQDALRVLGALFDSTSMEVTLMHVLELQWAAPLPAPAGEESDASELEDYQRELRRELRQNADAVIDRALRQAEQWSMPATSIIREGDPASELCNEADSGGYDLVVVGATGTSDVKHARLGSVSLKVAWDAPCSVAVIRRSV